VKVKITWYDKPALNAALRTALRAGQGPDIFYAEPDQVEYITNGFATPLDDLVNWNNIYDWARGVWTHNGKTYGLPQEAYTIELYYNKELMKKVGVDYVVVKAGQFKDLGNPGRPMTPDERRVLQTLLDDVHGQFIGAVASGRKLEREDVVRFADGRVFSGQQAKDLKMVDALGGLEDAVLAAGKLAGLPTPPAVIPPKRKFSFMDLLRNQFGGSAAAALLRPSLPAFKTPLYLMD